MALHVIRNKTTKEFRGMWPPIQPGQLSPDTTDITDDEEYVFLPQLEHDTVLAIAFQQSVEREPDPEKKKKIRAPGKIRVHDTHVDADPPTEKTTLAHQIRELRQANNRPAEGPVTLAELEAFGL